MVTEDKKSKGAPSIYKCEMAKKNLRLPLYIWEWLDTFAENRTKALIKLYNMVKGKE